MIKIKFLLFFLTLPVTLFGMGDILVEKKAEEIYIDLVSSSMDLQFAGYRKSKENSSKHYMPNDSEKELYKAFIAAADQLFQENNFSRKPFMVWINSYIMQNNLNESLDANGTRAETWFKNVDDSSLSLTETWFKYAPDCELRELSKLVLDGPRSMRNTCEKVSRFLSEEGKKDRYDEYINYTHYPYGPEEDDSTAFRNILLMIYHCIEQERAHPNCITLYSGTNIPVRVLMDLFNLVGKKLNPEKFTRYYLRIPNEEGNNGTFWSNLTPFENFYAPGDCTFHYLLGEHVRNPFYDQAIREKFIKELCCYFNQEISDERTQELDIHIKELIKILIQEYGCSMYQVFIPKQANELPRFGNFLRNDSGQRITLLDAYNEPKTFGQRPSQCYFRGYRKANFPFEQSEPIFRVFVTSKYSLLHNNQMDVRQYTPKSSKLMDTYYQQLAQVVDAFFSSAEDMAGVTEQFIDYLG